MLLVVALGTAGALAALLRPQFPNLRTAFRLASDLAGVVTFYFFLLAGEFIVANADAAARLNSLVHVGDRIFTAGQLANFAAALGPLIALILFFFDCFVEVTRLFLARRQPAIITHESNGIL
jgi:hypothetical protein